MEMEHRLLESGHPVEQRSGVGKKQINEVILSVWRGSAPSLMPNTLQAFGAGLDLQFQVRGRL